MILIILNVLFIGITYVHIAMQSSLLSLYRTFSSSQSEILYLLYNNFP